MRNATIAPTPPRPRPERLCDRLRRLREELDLSRETVGPKVGRSYGSVIHWERGAVIPPLPVLADLAALYGTTLPELVDNLVDV